MTTLTVAVQPDHLAKMAAAKTPLAAVAELIWNALDADATRVEVRIETSLLDTLTKVVVTDNGAGMEYDSTMRAFGSLGGSRKRTAVRSPGGRYLHGSQGKGRFKAFAIGNLVTWHTVARQVNEFVAYSIVGNRDNLGSFEVTDPVQSGTRATTTSVVIEELHDNSGQLRGTSAVNTLTEQFALFLLQYPDTAIEYNGTRLDPSTVIEARTDLQLDSETLQGTALANADVTIIEWRMEVERSLHLCDEHGVALHRTPVRIHAQGFQFTVYLKSAAIRQADQDGTLTLDEMSPPIALAMEAVRSTVRKHFRERAAARARSVVQEWKDDAIYPYSEEPATPLQVAERQVFDVVALNIHSLMPSFEDTDRNSKKLTFRLVRQALESDAGSLQLILQDVLQLSPDKREELAGLLKRTTLGAIISASRMVATRLDVLRGIEDMVFGENRYEVLERRHLHRIVAENSWLFDEQYHLSVDDQSLTEVLKAHCRQADLEILDDSPVTRSDGTQGIVDLMLSRTIPQPNRRDHEHVVIELKRPTVRIGQAEVAQVTSYAHAIIRDARFASTNTRWHFWALSAEIDPVVQALAATKRPGEPLQELEGRAKIWVKTWAEVINEAKAKLSRFEELLAYRADRDSAMAELRLTYARYLPDSMREGSAA